MAFSCCHHSHVGAPSIPPELRPIEIMYETADKGYILMLYYPHAKDVKITEYRSQHKFFAVAYRHDRNEPWQYYDWRKHYFMEN